jgi:hypothetical protein
VIVVVILVTVSQMRLIVRHVVMRIIMPFNATVRPIFVTLGSGRSQRRTSHIFGEVDRPSR